MDEELVTVRLRSLRKLWGREAGLYCHVGDLLDVIDQVPSLEELRRSISEWAVKAP